MVIKFLFLARCLLSLYLVAFVHAFPFPQYNLTQTVGHWLSPVTKNLPNVDVPAISNILEQAVAIRDRAQAYVSEELDKFSEKHAGFKEKFHVLDQDFRAMMADASKFNAIFEHVDRQKISEGWSKIQETVSTQVQNELAPLDSAGTHEQRVELIKRTLDKVEDQVVLVFGPYTETPESEFRKLFKTVRAAILKLLVTIGDLMKLYPRATEFLLFAVSVMLLSATPLLQGVLGLFGFGILGPVKGTAAAWAQRFFWGAAVKPGTWFALLQRLGMKGVPFVWNAVASAGVGGAVTKSLKKFFFRGNGTDSE